MKLQNVKDVRKLFEVVDSCKGKVELVTGEGDRLNLKSKPVYFPVRYLQGRRAGDPGDGDCRIRSGGCAEALQFHGERLRKRQRDRVHVSGGMKETGGSLSAGATLSAPYDLAEEVQIWEGVGSERSGSSFSRGFVLE